MNKKILFAFGIIFAIILISGCTIIEETKEKVSEVETPFAGAENFTDNPTVKCIDLCQQVAKTSAGIFPNGPCLNNEIVENWVCDVVHDPRQDIDNLPENQCEAFRNGTAKHFVEVDFNCNLVRTH